MKLNPPYCIRLPACFATFAAPCGAFAMLVALAISFAATTAHAADEYWDTGAAGTTVAAATSGTWDTTTTNWESTNSQIVFATGATAVFSTAGATVSASTGTNAGTSDSGSDTIVISLNNSGGISAAGMNANNTGFIISADPATTAANRTLTFTNLGNGVNGAGADITVAAGKVFSIGNNAILSFTGNTSSSPIFVGAGGTFNVEAGATLERTIAAPTTRGLIISGGVTNISGTVEYLSTVSDANGGIVIGQGGEAGGSVSTTVNLLSGGVIIANGDGTQAGFGTVTLSNNGSVTVLNVNGGALTTTDPGANAGINLARTGFNGTLNLNSGTITTSRIFKGSYSGGVNTPGTGSGVFNFNGGTLAANVTNNTNFMSSLTRINVSAGGAIIAPSGFSITISDPLLLSNVGGDAGTGGLTESGSGTLTLSNVETYAGATNVNGGQLILSSAATINASTGVTVNNGQFTQLSSAAETPSILVNSGTLNGTGRVGAVTFSGSAGSFLANGNNSNASISLSSLTINGPATINITNNALSASAPINNLGALVTSGSDLGEIVINGTGTWANGLNSLIGYSGFNVAHLTDFSVGTIGGLTGRQTQGLLTTTSTSIALNIIGDSLVWTGTGTTPTPAWTTGITGQLNASGTPSWVTKGGHQASDYWVGDIVEFDDTAQVGSSPGVVLVPSTAVNITGSNVTPASISFNNNLLAYTLSSSDGHGIVGNSAIAINGVGNVILSESNSYTGSTAINSGTLSLVGGSLAATAINVASAGTLTEDGASTIRTGASLSDTGSATLSGSNSYTGATTVGGSGLLTLNGTLNGSAVTVGSAATLTESSAGSILGAVAVNSAGTTNLSGANAYTGATNVTAGTLTLNGTLNGTSVTVSPGGTLTENASGTIVGGVAYNNSGTTTLSGNNPYTGATNANAGLLTLNGTLSASSITVAVGASFAEGANGSIAGSGVTLNNSGSTVLAGVNTFGGATTATSGTLEYDGTAAMSTASALTTRNGSIVALRADTSGTFTTSAWAPNGAPAVSTIDVNELTAGHTGQTLSFNSVATIAVGGNGANGAMVLDVTGGSGDALQILGNVAFTGNPGNTWELVPTSANLIYAGNIAGTNTGQTLILDGTSSGNVISGVISTSGSLAVTKTNTSTWALTNTDTYAGATIVNGGTLIVTGSLSGTTAVSVGAGATLNVNGLVNTAITITGSSGRLSGDGMIGSAAITDGTLAPGFSVTNTAIPGTLTATGTGVSLDSASTFSIRLGVAAAGDNDSLLMTSGTVSLNGATLAARAGAAYSTDSLAIIIINGGYFTGTSGTFSNSTVTVGLDTYNIVYGTDINGNAGAGNDVALELSAVPEPGTYAMVLGGVGMLGFWQRLRRRSRGSA